MQHNALNLLRSGSEYVLNKAKGYFLPKIGNLIGKGIDIGSDYISPKYSKKVSDLFDSIHGVVKDSNYSQKFPSEVIYPSMNANFGVGTLGTRELASAFIGDRQGLAEHYEKIEHNPEPSIFRQAKERMPMSLMLPEKKRKKRRAPKKKIPTYLLEEEQFGEEIYGPKKKRRIYKPTI